MGLNRTIPSQAPFGFLVKTLTMVSESDAKTLYDLTMPSCTCPSFRFSLAKLIDDPETVPDCKHLKKARLAGLAQWLDPFGEGENEKLNPKDAK